MIGLLSLLLAFGAGCSKETLRSMSNLSALRSDLMREYKANDVNVVVQNSNVLGISFVNSSFNNLGAQEREKKAREIALFAKSHYQAINSIDKIWVSFLVVKNYIVFHYTNGLGTYVYDKRSLTSPDGRTQGTVTASYNSTSNETNVYLNNNLQVYGNDRNGIMLFPHFVIPGDNVSAPKVVIPKSVLLDFSTYSDKRMFPNNPKLIISVDEQKIFSGNAKTTKVLGSDAETSVNEFLSQEVTYAQFVQLTNGSDVRFTLGAKEFKLTRSQLEALRAMRRCVEELRCE
jgi:hypothetical protein